MQEKYIGRLLEDGHLSIPKEIVEKLKINQDSAIHVIVQVRGQSQKKKIMSYAGLLSDLSEEEEKQFDEAIKRRNLFEKRKADPTSSVTSPNRSTGAYAGQRFIHGKNCRICFLPQSANA